MIYSTSPRVVSRIIAAILALIFALTAVKIFCEIRSENGVGGEGGGVGGNETDATVNVGEGDGGQIPENSIFATDGAITIGSVIGGKSAIICDLKAQKVVAQKNIHGSLGLKDASVFMTALTVSKAANEGRVALTDYAVCPASAAKSEYYSLSKDILPIGKRMRVGDILKCMIYQSGSSYAYTLAVHISGSEEAFTAEMNEYAKAIGLTDTVFMDCRGESGSTSVYDLAVILNRVLADPLLKEILFSDDMLTVGYGQSGSVELAVKNDFFETYCTKNQAQHDGIAGGKVGAIGYEHWAVAIFIYEGKEYLCCVLDSKEAFSDMLMMYSAYVLS